MLSKPVHAVERYLKLAGGNLWEALLEDAEGNLGWYQHGKNILLDVIRGLHFLHSNKVAHRYASVKSVERQRATEHCESERKVLEIAV